MRDYMRTRRADTELAAQHRDYDRRSQLKRLTTHGHWRQVYPARALRTDALRRARLQAALVEAFAPRAVLDRDGWVCQLCLQPIDPAVAWPASLSPSVDHVIPLAKGGLHAMTNVQAAHLGCNSRKGDRVEDDRELVDHGFYSAKITLGGDS
ncbi:HNH endonuclease [Streptomyces sp. NPDC055025]